MPDEPYLWFLCSLMFFVCLGKMFVCLRTSEKGVPPEVRLLDAAILNGILATLTGIGWALHYWVIGVDQMPLFVAALGLLTIAGTELIIRKLMLSPPAQY